MDFKLDETNMVLRSQYEKNNYRDIIFGEGQNCIIFFSGNGLYYPNDKAVFESTIIEQDRYEWENIACADEIKCWADRIIYIRDIYKSWYVKGINQEINSIDKMILWLLEITRGWNVVACGNSAGGYMAALAASKLNAKCAFSFGGQWDLVQAKKENNIVASYVQNYSVRKYYDLPGLLKDNCTPIFWFYSAKCDYDRFQLQLFQKNAMPNVYDFAVDSDVHGYLLLSGCYEKLLVMEPEKLIKLYEKYYGKLIKRKGFCLELMNLREAMMLWKKDMIDNHRLLQILGRFWNR